MGRKKKAPEEKKATRHFYFDKRQWDRLLQAAKNKGFKTPQLLIIADYKLDEV